TPLELAAIRAAIGFIGLVLWVGARRRRLSVRARDLPLFVLYGFISIALFQWAYFATLEHTTVAISVALLYTAPAFVVVISRLFGGEALSRARLAALGMVLAGVFLVTGALRALLSGGASISAAALGYGLLSGLTYGMYTIFGKLAVRDHDPVETVMLAFLFGAIALSALAVRLLHPGAPPPPARAGKPPGDVRARRRHAPRRVRPGRGARRRPRRGDRAQRGRPNPQSPRRRAASARGPPPPGGGRGIDV